MLVQRQLSGGDDVRRESGVKPELLTKQVLFCILGSWLNRCAWNIQDFGKGEGMFVQKVHGNFLNIGMPVQGKKRGRSILLALRPPDGQPSGASREGPYNLIPFSSL